MAETILRFCGDIDALDPSSLAYYQTPIFPPDGNFCVSIDATGNAKSKYSDDFWDMSEQNYYGFDFAQYQLSEVNRDLLKQVIFLHLYHIPLFPGTLRVVSKRLGLLGSLCRYIDDNNIRLDQLYRFPRTAIVLSKLFTPAQFEKLIRVLEQVYVEKRVLGWQAVDERYLDELRKALKPSITVQNAYIPPRLWLALIESAEAVMSDFETQKGAIEEAWIWIHRAYKKNIENGYFHINPFRKYNLKDNSCSGRIRYEEGGEAFLVERGIMASMECWFDQTLIKHKGAAILTNYVNLVRDCSFLYILAHSLQRQSEGLSLRADCFLIDDDPIFGSVAMLVGETTKTDADNDARWVVPIQVKRAIDILKYIGRLRIAHTLMNVDDQVKENPYLMAGVGECWVAGHSSSDKMMVERVKEFNLTKIIPKYPNVFCPSKLTITREDYDIAYNLTPALTQKKWFEVGNHWHFNPHQLRRTLAVNMYTQNVSDSVIQWQMKHRTIQQSYYYGRNHTRLLVNSGVKDVCQTERNRGTALALIDLVENKNGDNVLATSYNPIPLEILSLIEERDYRKLEVAAKKGQISIRTTMLGLCMAKTCKYGGIESAIHCAGIDGKAPCKDAIFRKPNASKLRALKQRNTEEISTLKPLTPRHAKLENENKAIEVFLDATST
ncbi:hypothetical protein NBRC116583_34900 [Arenicella sp. 4NH20-0111]|uniref:hypothetical protein n=1 Tax=Arenicella sp. 4NH20-0111 TaxID=3127648 RepID=UPI00310935EB